MRTLPQGHRATCRCAQCRQEKLPSLAQEFLPMFASAIATRRNYPNFEVEPFAGFTTESESLPWLSNEVTDERDAEWGRRGPTPRHGVQIRPRRPPSRRWPRRARRPRRGFATEPTVIEAQGSEQVRWVQNALNRIMGLNLPVNGIMSVATRSAVRSFQRERGLPVSGIVGPDTVEALRAAFSGQSAGMDDASEYAEEIEIGPLTATLEWLKPTINPESYLFKLAEARTKDVGGVYIVVDIKKRVNNHPLILKVGKTESFKSRFGGNRYYDDPKKFYATPGDLRFYLGKIEGLVDPSTHVERALARLLINRGQSLPKSRTVPTQPVKGRVELTNILPRPLKDRFGHPGKLTLDQKTTPTWEVS